jgi:hypothetical protein
MRQFVLLISLVLTSCVSGQVQTFSSKKFEDIALRCLESYQKLSNEPISNEVDRAYVHQGDEVSDILFTRGSVGTFTYRDKDYQSFLACRIGNEIPNIIYHLKYGYDDILISNDAYKVNLDLYKSKKVLEVLLIRGESRFIFSKKQIFSEERLGTQ